MTITAISTPPGTGGIAIIRISGRQAITIADKIFRPKNTNKTLQTQQHQTITYGTIINPETNTSIDEVLVSLFHAPHSFTGENTIEIACHGSIYIQQTILQLLIQQGARIATPGEFTQRAFLNGRLDLSQAEAIADLIQSQSAAEHRIALNQMRGNFSSELTMLRQQLLTFASLIELELDFGDHEELEFADRTELNTLAHDINTHLNKLINSFSTGNAIKNGIPVAIVGETNAGKSTLLNLLVGDERAIVSSIHGTTRDLIEDTVTINGLLFRFIDTAGIRETTDEIESIGIKRSFTTIERANIILWVIDSTDITEQIEWLAGQIIKRADNKKVILVLNKTEKLTREEHHSLDTIFQQYQLPSIKISAKQQINTDQLTTLLYDTAQIPQITEQDTLVTNIRHYEALSLAQQAIQRAIDGLLTNLPADLVAQDIRECTIHLGTITGGEITTEEVLGNIFSKFCIGK